MVDMTSISGWGQRARALFSDNKGPWGPSGSGGNEDGKPSDPSPGPWGEGAPPKRRRGADRPASSLDELLKKGRMGGGPPAGGGGRSFNLGETPDGLWKWAILGVLALWLLFTTFHSIAPNERGVVTRLGRYSHTLGPGVGITLPAPFDRVQKVEVDNIRNIDLGSAESEDLMLTGDQNIIDIAYQVRWKIKDPELYLFELARPEDTIRQVAESTMRAVVANVTLQDAIGNRRGEMQAQVAQDMQAVLDSYEAGVSIQGVAIKQADPPAAVNDAFKEVTAAQQEAQSYINQANAYSLQLRQRAQGEATAFDKVYEQYRLAPGVTRRRMYYETMERVLQGVDKTIVEAPGVNSYLPLNELKRSAPRQEAGQ